MIDGPTLPTLAAERVVLRWLTDDDVPALYRIFSDPQVMRYWSHGPFTGLADAEEYLALIRRCFEEKSLFQWGVALADTDEVIGTCTLSSVNPTHRRAEIGYALARAHWGRGYMAEALPALLRFAFGTLGLHRIEADVDPRNVASLKSLERLGFTREGYLRERYHVNGEVQDTVLFGLLRSDAPGLV
jgi:[ribosomal protein S5]-alanine N-acetyltransferase